MSAIGRFTCISIFILMSVFDGCVLFIDCSLYLWLNIIIIVFVWHRSCVEVVSSFIFDQSFLCRFLWHFKEGFVSPCFVPLSDKLNLTVCWYYCKLPTLCMWFNAAIMWLIMWFNAAIMWLIMWFNAGIMPEYLSHL